jgi:hypothetical protein
MTAAARELQADDDVVVAPTRLPLVFAPAGPVIGQATIIRTDDGNLAVVVTASTAAPSWGSGSSISASATATDASRASLRP